MNNPKVSICIPCYNNVEGIKRLLDSITEQIFMDYEVIVTDDSTSDNVKKIVTQYKNIRYYHNTERLGATKNCNAAIAKATGKYIKLMHHDDWFTDIYSLDNFVYMMEKNPNAILAFSGTVQVQENDSYKRHISKEDASMYEKDYRMVFLRNKIGAPSAVIFQNKNVSFDENLTWLVDMDLYLQLLKDNDTFIYSEEPYVCIGMSDEQLTRSCMCDVELQKREYAYVFQKHKLTRNRKCKVFFVRKMISLGAKKVEICKNDISNSFYSLIFLYEKLREYKNTRV